MKHYLMGVSILLVLGIALFLVETHRQWSLIVFLLAIIFYALFANPWKQVHEETFGKDSQRMRKTSSKKKKKK